MRSTKNHDHQRGPETEQGKLSGAPMAYHAGSTASASAKPAGPEDIEHMQLAHIDQEVVEALDEKRRQIDESIIAFQQLKEREFAEYEDELIASWKAQGHYLRSEAASEHEMASESRSVDRDEEFQGLFTPTYLPLLSRKRSRSDRNYPLAPSVTDEDVSESLDGPPLLGRDSSLSGSPTKNKDKGKGRRKENKQEKQEPHRPGISKKARSSGSRRNSKSVRFSIGEQIVSPSSNIEDSPSHDTGVANTATGASNVISISDLEDSVAPRPDPRTAPRVDNQLPPAPPPPPQSQSQPQPQQQTQAELHAQRQLPRAQVPMRSKYTSAYHYSPSDGDDETASKQGDYESEEGIFEFSPDASQSPDKKQRFLSSNPRASSSISARMYVDRTGESAITTSASSASGERHPPTRAPPPSPWDFSTGPYDRTAGLADFGPPVPPPPQSPPPPAALPSTSPARDIPSSGGSGPGGIGGLIYRAANRRSASLSASAGAGPFNPKSFTPASPGSKRASYTPMTSKTELEEMMTPSAADAGALGQDDGGGGNANDNGDDNGNGDGADGATRASSPAPEGIDLQSSSMLSFHSLPLTRAPGSFSERLLREDNARNTGQNTVVDHDWSRRGSSAGALHWRGGRWMAP
ncbi:MAG: hypothetical protein M1825_001482 [Sarcosagium campestre]|nr:MAG: hypothetical protein M1825_001482 [Sarcosagium campestre]